MKGDHTSNGFNWELRQSQHRPEALPLGVDTLMEYLAGICDHTNLTLILVHIDANIFYVDFSMSLAPGCPGGPACCSAACTTCFSSRFGLRSARLRRSLSGRDFSLCLGTSPGAMPPRRS